MGKNTAISWCDHTWNPWWGCNKVSPGCDHCYADTFAKRTGRSLWGSPMLGTPRRLFGDKHWAEPLTWNRDAERAGERRRVFCASMADVFEFNPALDPERAKLWPLIEQTPALDWLLLTKRPQLILRLVPEAWRAGFPPNVWIGTSVEDQARADLRIPVLLQVPAVVRFLSCEPLLGPVDLIGQEWWDWRYAYAFNQGMFPRPIDWIITGGESGPGHRPMHPDWARSLRDQCQEAGVAFFHKQNGGATHAAGGDLLDGRQHHEFPEAVAA